MTLLDLDIRTTMRLLVLGNLLATAMLLAYRNPQHAEHPVRVFLTGKVVQSIGWLLLSLRGDIPLLLSAHFANFMLLTGFALEMLAFSRLDKRRHAFEMALIVPVVAGSLSLWLYPDPSTWVATVSIAVICIYAPTAIILYRQPAASRLLRTICRFFLVFCAVMALRVHSAMTEHIGLLSVSPIQTLTFFSLFGFMVVGGIGFLLLAKEKVDHDLEYAATTDALTGVLNRRAFFEHCKLAMNIAIRSRKTVTLLMLDLDHFKGINDQYGHATGDAVLQSFANTVRQQIRQHDVFGRVGGEEFAILLFDSQNNAMDIAERIRAAVAAQSADTARTLHYTVSIGRCMLHSGKPR